MPRIRTKGGPKSNNRVNEKIYFKLLSSNEKNIGCRERKNRVFLYCRYTASLSFHVHSLLRITVLFRLIQSSPLCFKWSMACPMISSSPRKWTCRLFLRLWSNCVGFTSCKKNRNSFLKVLLKRGIFLKGRKCTFIRNSFPPLKVVLHRFFYHQIALKSQLETLRAGLFITLLS